MSNPMVDIINEFNMYNDGDEWDCTMSALFDCCAIMHNNDIPIPNEWKYTASPLGVDVESNEYLLDYSLEVVEGFAHYLHMVVEILLYFGSC